MPRDFDKFTTISVFFVFLPDVTSALNVVKFLMSVSYYNAEVVNPWAYDYCTGLSPSDFDSVVTQ